MAHHPFAAQWRENVTDDIRVHEALQQLERSTALKQTLIETQDYAAVQRVYEEIKDMRSSSPYIPVKFDRSLLIYVDADNRAYMLKEIETELKGVLDHQVTLRFHRRLSVSLVINGTT